MWQDCRLALLCRPAMVILLGCSLSPHWTRIEDCVERQSAQPVIRLKLSPRCRASGYEPARLVLQYATLTLPYAPMRVYSCLSATSSSTSSSLSLSPSLSRSLSHLASPYLPTRVPSLGTSVSRAPHSSSSRSSSCHSSSGHSMSYRMEGVPSRSSPNEMACPRSKMYLISELVL